VFVIYNAFTSSKFDSAATKSDEHVEGSISDIILTESGSVETRHTSQPTKINAVISSSFAPVLSELYSPVSSINTLTSTINSIIPTAESARFSNYSLPINTYSSYLQSISGLSAASLQKEPIADISSIYSTSMVKYLTTTDQVPSHSACDCRYYLTLNSSTLQIKISQLKADLRVNRTKLSSVVRKLTCATDDRVVSTSMGYVGVTILSVTFLICIVFDFLRLVLNY